MTCALAGDFERVVGLDVSSDMLDLARAVVPESVELIQVEGTEIPLADNSVDAIFSTHVLQHLDGLDVVSAYLREARRVLRTGGSAMLHIPISSAEPALRLRIRTELALRKSRGALARGEETYHARVRTYQPEQLRETLIGIGFESVELRVFPVRSNGDPHAFWLAR